MNTIFNGIVVDDSYSTRESTLAVLRSYNLGFCLSLGDWQWQFTAPIEPQSSFYYDKKTLIKFALKEKLALEKTWSCDNLFWWPCGVCASCQARQQLFEQLKLKPPPKWLGLMQKFSRWSKTKRQKIQRFMNTIKLNMQRQALPKNTLLRENAFMIHPQVKFEKVKQSMLLLHQEYGTLLQLNASGALLWQALARHKTLSYQKLKRLLRQHYVVKEAIVDRDLTNLLKRLVRDGYLLRV